MRLAFFHYGGTENRKKTAKKRQISGKRDPKIFSPVAGYFFLIGWSKNGGKGGKKYTLFPPREVCDVLYVSITIAHCNGAASYFDHGAGHVQLKTANPQHECIPIPVTLADLGCSPRRELKNTL